MVKLFVAGSACDNILVRGVNWVGDAVMTLPALRAIRRSRPNSKITLLVKPWVAPLFEKDPNVDEIILYLDEYKGVTGKLKLARRLASRRFCMAVLFQNAIDAAIISFLAGIPERIGYSRDGRGLLLSRAVPFDERAGAMHHIDYYLNLLKVSGFEVRKEEPWISLTMDERLKARERISSLKRPVIGLNPGAAYGSSKRWLPGRFAEVGRKVIEELDGSVVVYGGPGETEVASEIAQGIGRQDRCMNFGGKTSLRELISLVSECDLLLTNDSGPMHVGYAVGTPVVAVFGSTSPELTGPVGGGNTVLRRGTDCAPCFERECAKGDMKCMDLVSADAAFSAVRELVGTRRAVFFDRDGTLCRDAHYLSRMDDFEVLPGIGSLGRLKDAGFLLIGVTNQSGIARGIVQEDFVEKVNGIFLEQYGFDGFYYCPHHPDERCSCRKPEPGLLLRARKEFGIDLKGSFVVGDKDIDMLLAKASGATGIHVGTGQEPASSHADYAAGNLQEAVEMILEAKK